MTFAVTETMEGKIIEVQITGKLTKEAYQEFVPATEAAIKKFGKVRMLVIMHDFHGWTAGAVGRHQVRHEAFFGHRTAGDRRRNEVGTRHGDVLPAIHHRQNQVFRPQRRRSGAGLDSGVKRATLP